jgi:5-methylcytosine-specific restriction endonuclease McrA
MEFSEKIIQSIWDKGLCVGADSTKCRKDAAYAWILRDQYGKESAYGWSIDHIVPISKGGKDDYENLRPMHWENNKCKADDYPNYNSVITSEGNKNIRKSQECTVDENLQAKLRSLYYL